MQKLIIILTTFSVLLAPWLFGAWESWWFWSFTMLIFLAGALFGVQQLLALRTTRQEPSETSTLNEEHQVWLRRQRNLVLMCLPMIIYGAWSLTRPIAYMLAERSWLLFVTSTVLSVVIIYAYSAYDRRRLFTFMLANYLLLGLYGIINHVATGSEIVLWAKGYPQYIVDGRATGSYFCPNHFAGIMEMATGLGLGVFLARRVSLRQRLIGVCLIVLGCVCVVMSKSRAGGLTLLGVCLCTLHWGFVNWPRRARWWWRAASLAMCGIIMSGVLLFADGFTKRFTSYFATDQVEGRSRQQALNEVEGRLKDDCRPRMYRAAIRAWKSSPIIGIGPGMNSVVWPHFNASSDGDREQYLWPSETNYSFSANETHSDWLELLEEYGIVGFLLVLVPLLYLCHVLSKALRQDATDRRDHSTTGIHFPRESMALGALLALSAMVFHSLLDFNLQIPANTWNFSVIIAIALGMMGELRVRSRR